MTPAAMPPASGPISRPTRRAALAGLAAVAFSGSARGAAPGLDEALAERARRLDQLHALVVAHEGETVFARAFRGPPLERPVNVKSVSKTVVAALAGIALDRGALESVDQRLVEIMPARVPPGADPRVGDITIGHLLTMQAGLERTSGPNYGAWVESGNWVADALRRPFVAEPGGRMLYSTGSYHLLGVALTEATGRSLLDLARDWLGEPLGVEIPPWTRDPQGFSMGGNNMALSPLALLRFGETFRRGGVWEGTRVVSEDWVERSWTPRARSPWSGHDYGYGWFLAGAGGRKLAYARGYGGQMLYVSPDLGLTMVVTSDPTRPARSGGYVGDLHAMLSETVIPALAGG